MGEGKGRGEEEEWGPAKRNRKKERGAFPLRVRSCWKLAQGSLARQLAIAAMCAEVRPSVGSRGKVAKTRPAREDSSSDGLHMVSWEKTETAISLTSIPASASPA